jgi:hypothetical protein
VSIFSDIFPGLFAPRCRHLFTTTTRTLSNHDGPCVASATICNDCHTVVGHGAPMDMAAVEKLLQRAAQLPRGQIEEIKS